MNEHHILELVKETCDRTKRMETRMVSMASQMGIDLQNGQKLTFTWTASGVIVDLVGLDVSISRIKNALRQEYPERHGTARVFHDGRHVASVIY